MSRYIYIYRYVCRYNFAHRWSRVLTNQARDTILRITLAGAHDFAHEFAGKLSIIAQMHVGRTLTSARHARYV